MMKLPEHRDLAARLPEDVLADVLRRGVAPCWLAVSRCVCNAWRAIIDGDGLLCTELPFSGIFIAFTELPLPEFFPRPPSPVQPAVSGKLDFLPTAITDDSDEFTIQDHCNGLLLLSTYSVESSILEQREYKINPVRRATYVVNLATRTWDRLPSYPPNHAGGIVRGSICFHNYHLAFDPKVSSSYQVLGIPWWFSGKRDNESEYDPLEELSEWPPSPYILPVFSSKTRCWEMRSFSRQGDAAGTVAETRAHSSSYHKLHSVYWRGSLYVHCQSNLVMRISMSEDKYTVIKPPTGVQMYPYLGRSEKGVYLASFAESSIRVFILNEFSDRTEWIFKHDYDLRPLKAFHQQVHGPWILEDINFHFFPPEINDKPVIHENFEWDSDNEDFADIGDAVEACPARHTDIVILGFHPYKEILFLSRSETCKQNDMAFAYHLNSFKIESLGSIYPTDYDSFDSGLANETREIEPFPYTPCCWIEHIPETVN